MRRDIEAGEGAPGSEGWLRPGLTCWRRERAHRAAVLHDGAAYFAAARAALVKAQRTITLIGWSFDPRVRLLPSAGDPESDQTMADLLRALKAARPDLTIRILIWDMPWPISAGNDHTPDSVRESLGTGIDFRIDGTLPYGACQHQKILVIDDTIAFCGGSDFEVNRWDTPAHRDRDPRRRLPSGEDYPPRHDVMMLVDGPAAGALADLARERWRRATGEVLSPTVAAPVDPWPETVAPLLTEVEVGLSRTEPALAHRPERRFSARGEKAMRPESRAAVAENAALYLASIRGAKDFIYLENQYLASPVVADALRARLAEPDGPEIVIVLSERSPNRFDQLTMDSARRGLIKGLRRADRHGRLRIVAPHTPEGRPILIHSKVAIIDRRFLRIGSTNLNNRSFGYDTECDLSIELRADDAAGRAALDRVLHALLGHHGGCPAETFAKAYAERASLRAVLDDPALMPSPRLCTLVPSHRGPIARLVEAFHLGDPAGSEDAWRPWRRRAVLRRARRGDPVDAAPPAKTVEA